jgi:hypothetical protein
MPEIVRAGSKRCLAGFALAKVGLHLALVFFDEGGNREESDERNPAALSK